MGYMLYVKISLMGNMKIPYLPKITRPIMELKKYLPSIRYF